MASDKNQKFNPEKVKHLRLPVSYFRRTKEATLHNRNIFDALYGNLVKKMKTPKGIPLKYGS